MNNISRVANVDLRRAKSFFDGYPIGNESSFYRQKVVFTRKRCDFLEAAIPRFGDVVGLESVDHVPSLIEIDAGFGQSVIFKTIAEANFYMHPMFQTSPMHSLTMRLYFPPGAIPVQCTAFFYGFFLSTSTVDSFKAIGQMEWPVTKNTTLKTIGNKTFFIKRPQARL